MSDITPADALRELGDDQAEYAAAAAKKAGEPTWSGLFGAGGPDFDFDPDDTEGHKRIAALEAEVVRLAKVLEAVEDLADVGPLDHGVACESHYNSAPCDCLAARLRAVLDASAQESP